MTKVRSMNFDEDLNNAIDEYEKASEDVDRFIKHARWNFFYGTKGKRNVR